MLQEEVKEKRQTEGERKKERIIQTKAGGEKKKWRFYYTTFEWKLPEKSMKPVIYTAFYELIVHIQIVRAYRNYRRKQQTWMWYKTDVIIQTCCAIDFLRLLFLMTFFSLYLDSYTTKAFNLSIFIKYSCVFLLFRSCRVTEHHGSIILCLLRV